LKEKDYIDAGDLARLLAVQAILSDCMCVDNPNKTRLKSVRANISLMVDSLFEQIEINEET
jgi:hypothetical protein